MFAHITSLALIKVKLFNKDVHNLVQPISPACLFQNHSLGLASLSYTTLGIVTHTVPFVYDTQV